MAAIGVDCPDCGARLPRKAGAPCTCGWSPPAVLAASVETGCRWLTDGRTCRLPSTGGHRRLCSWHDLHADVARGRHDYDVFETYVTRLFAFGYCCTETHYPASVLWSWLDGRAVPAAPSPCNRISCHLRPDDDPAWDIRSGSLVHPPPEVQARRDAWVAHRQRRPPDQAT